MMRPRLIALALLLVGCGDSVLVCAQRGCEGGLTVRLIGYTGGPYRLEAKPGGGNGPAFVYECPTGGYCDKASFEDFIAKNFVLHLITPAGDRGEYLYTDVKYNPVYPNGRKCGVACERAEVQLPFQ
jgi:hypothetical protein